MTNDTRDVRRAHGRRTGLRQPARWLLAAGVVGAGILSILGSSPLTAEDCERDPSLCNWSFGGTGSIAGDYVSEDCKQAGSGKQLFQIAIKDSSTQCVPGFAEAYATSAQAAAQCPKAGYVTAHTVLRADFRAADGTHATVSSDNEANAAACVRNTCTDGASCGLSRNPDQGVDSCLQRDSSTGAYSQVQMSVCQ